MPHGIRTHWPIEASFPLGIEHDFRLIFRRAKVLETMNAKGKEVEEQPPYTTG